MFVYFGVDVIQGDVGDDVIQGDAGDEVIHGDAGDDVVDGDAGYDAVRSFIEGDVGGDVFSDVVVDKVIVDGARDRVVRDVIVEILLVGFVVKICYCGGGLCAAFFGIAVAVLIVLGVGRC